MARTYKDESGLNKQSEFAMSADAQVLFTHKFTWKLSEVGMVLGIGGLGIFLALFVEPIALGLGFFGGALYLVTVNNHKKKKSLLELVKDKDGLRLYHNGALSESSTHDDMTLDDVKEIIVVQTHPLPKLLLRSEPNAENETKSIRIPIRFLRSPEFQEFINSKSKSGELKVSKQVLEEMSNWTK